MKKHDEKLETDTKAKMLFNSDGFEFFLKFISVLFTIIGTMLIVVFKIIGILCEISSKKEINDDDSAYPIDNIVAHRDENGTTYNADGDTL